MTDQRTLVVASFLLLTIFGLSQSDSYILAGQPDDDRNDLSISNAPFYIATNGTITGERAIDVHSEDRRSEVSFIEDAIVENVGNVSNIGTFVEHIISSDIIRGNGEGIITSADGNSTIGWTAYDLGERSGDGSFILRGIIFFHLLSPEDETDNVFRFLDNSVGLYRNVFNPDAVEEYVGREIWAFN
jgi:hypothetical protein